MENNDAFIALSELYEDGDRDWISLGQLLGEVSYDANDVKYPKSNTQRITDMICLLRYLCLSGDFEVGRITPSETGKTQFIATEKPIDEICREIERNARIHGLESGKFLMGIWLRKLRLGKSPDSPSKEIEEIFRP